MYTKQLAQLISTVCTGLLLSTSITSAEDKANEGISPQPLTSALAEFAEQSGLQLVYLTELTEGVDSQGADAADGADETLTQLLADTGLRYEFINDRTVSIEQQQISSGVSAEGSSLGNAQASSSQILMAQNQTPTLQSQTSQSNQTGSEDSETLPFRIEEIIVTGTSIRGLLNTASPLLQFDREEIVQSGVATIGEFIQRAVPQNFSAGAIEDGFTNPRENSQLNLSGGTGINLRGLGNDSTLVLINGRRLAPSALGTFVDVSQIPLTAIERVDVLTDGASAIYGSDAIGGVVNFILRNDYEGAETTVRFGPDIGNDFDEVRFSQTFGKNWGSGNLLVSYEYYDRSNLGSEERSLTVDALDFTDILPDQERHSLFLSLGQELSEYVELYSTTLYTDRDASRNNFDRFANIPQRRDSDVEQVSVLVGVRTEIGSSWQADFAANYSKASAQTEFILSNTEESGGITESDSDTWAIDAKLDGNIASLQGGMVKLAVGGQFRQEGLEEPASLSFPARSLDRDVTAIFGELFLPIIGETNMRWGLRSLELTLAARYEDYNDFGDSTDPKVGLLWSPTEGLNARMTWGTSYRAPLLDELDDALLSLGLIALPDPASATGTTVVAIPQGKNADLIPEEASTWTLGFDFLPQSVPGFELGLTYFNIEFDNRIAAPDILSILGGAFTDPTLAPIVDRNFDSAALNRYFEIASAIPGNFFAIGGVTLSDVEAIVDGRIQNLSTTVVSGMDVTIGYTVDETRSGDWGFSLSGTYLNEFENQFTETSIPEDVVGTVFRPPEWRVRAGVSWSKDWLSANTYANYVDELVDHRSDPSISIASFTTVDLQFNIDFGQWAGLDGLSMNFSTLNLFDEKPPFVEDTLTNLNFDPENHNIVGRIIALGVTYEWH